MAEIPKELKSYTEKLLTLAKTTPSIAGVDPVRVALLTAVEETMRYMMEEVCSACGESGISPRCTDPIAEKITRAEHLRRKEAEG